MNRNQPTTGNQQTNLPGVKYQILKLIPYSIKELAEIYQVDRRTFARWLKPFYFSIGEKNGRYYNITQVRIILDKLGAPGTIIMDEQGE